MVDMNRLEVERIRNLVQGFQWEVIKEEVTEEDIILVMKKPRVAKAEIPKVGPG
jgi:hypothetical protein